MKRAGAVVTGALLLPIADTLTSHTNFVGAAPSTSISRLTGTVQQVDPSGILHLRGQDGTHTINVTSGTTFFRGREGRVSGLSAYIPGDEIVAEGKPTGGNFAATKLMTMNHEIRGRITQWQGDRVQTTSGTVLLIPDTRALANNRFTGKPLPPLSVGEVIDAEVWRDPATGDLVAWMLGPEGGA